MRRLLGAPRRELGLRFGGGLFVNKAALASESTAELAKATTTLSNYELNLLNNQIKVTCTGLQNNEAFIVGTNLFKAKSLSFTGCSSNAVNCPIEPTITTTAVRGSVVSGTPDTIKIEPVAGSTALLAVVEFTGPLCALSELPVKGNFTEILLGSWYRTGRTSTDGQRQRTEIGQRHRHIDGILRLQARRERQHLELPLSTNTWSPQSGRHPR